MCFTLREADQMIDAARRNRVTLMVGYMKRHDPAYALAQQQLGSMSGLRHVLVTTLNGPLAPYVSHYPLRRFQDVPAETGARAAAARTTLLEEALGLPLTQELRSAYHEVLLDSAIHEINLIRGLIGDPLRVVSAHFWDGGQSFVTHFEFPNELRASLSFVTLSDFRGYRQELNFYGTSAGVTVAFPSPFLRSEPTKVIVEEHRGSELWRSEAIVSHDEAFKRELLHFHACVTQGAAPIVAGEDGKSDVELALAIMRSHISGEPQIYGGEAEAAQKG
jgi:predicted dehydrogenase